MWISIFFARRWCLITGLIASKRDFLQLIMQYIDITHEPFCQLLVIMHFTSYLSKHIQRHNYLNLAFSYYFYKNMCFEISDSYLLNIFQTDNMLVHKFFMLFHKFSAPLLSITNFKHLVKSIVEKNIGFSISICPN